MSRRYTFSNWLKSQVGRNDPVGDLAGDVANDKTAPLGAFRIKRWRQYLQSQNACDGAVKALEQAFDEWITKR